MSAHDVTIGAISRSHTDLFTRFAQAAAHWTGRPIALLIAVSFILIWAVTGPLFGYSDTWQLVINTSTTIITFLMVFLIQNTQNWHTLAADRRRIDHRDARCTQPARRHRRSERHRPRSLCTTNTASAPGRRSTVLEQRRTNVDNRAV